MYRYSGGISTLPESLSVCKSHREESFTQFCDKNTPVETIFLSSDYPSVRLRGHPSGRFLGHHPMGSGKAGMGAVAGTVFVVDMDGRVGTDAAEGKAGSPTGGSADPESVRYM